MSYLGRQNYKMVNGRTQLPHNYVYPGNPTVDVNPPIVNMTWLNSETYETFVCSDNTIGSNVWINSKGYRIYDLPTQPFCEYVPVEGASRMADYYGNYPILYGYGTVINTGDGLDITSLGHLMSDLESGSQVPLELQGAVDFTITCQATFHSIGQDLASYKIYLYSFGSLSNYRAVGLCSTDAGLKLIRYADDNLFSGFTPVAETLYHVTLVRDADVYLLYIDGTYISSLTPTISSNTGPDNFAVGRWMDYENGTEYTDALIKNLRMFNYALTADEVNKLYIADNA